MKTTSIQLIVLLTALVGCSSSSDTPGDEGKGNTPNNTPGNTPGMTKPPADDPGTKPGTTDEPTDPGTMMGAAGSAATDPGDDMKPTEPMTPPDMMADSEFPDLRGVGCKVESDFPGDETCLAPPKEGEGIQIHVGPSNYTDPAEIDKFIFHPGEEISRCWTVHTTNTAEVFYQGSLLSGRPGTHHIINTAYSADSGLTDGGFTACSSGVGPTTGSGSIGALPGASKSYMPRRPIAPENEHLGRALPANTPMQADMHYFNFTDKDILREFWLNLYTVPKDQVTDTSNQIRGMGGFGWQITPGTDHVYQYTAPIMADGRIIELLGHYHAHGKRFTAYIKRVSGEQEKVFEMYDYLDPLIFDYNTITENPAFSDSSGGAVTGMLEVKAGDILQWECHIVNDSTETLTYVNEVNTGEMCNIWGASVGNKIDKLSAAEIPFTIE